MKSFIANLRILNEELAVTKKIFSNILENCEDRRKKQKRNTQMQ